MKTNEFIELHAVPRTPGKSQARSLRLDRMIPAIIYGPQNENTLFSIPLVQAEKFGGHHYESSMFVLKSEDKNLDGIEVLRKDIERHPATHKPIHIDFYAPDMKKTVQVNVELIFDGKPIGTKEAGGLFTAARRDIEVECLPSDIPESIHVDVSELGLHESYHVSDIAQAPKGVKILTSPELTICSVNPPQEEKVEETEEVAAADVPTEAESKKPAADKE
ncbi:MAG: 50S ribosomal protein L25 [Bdellovibrionales bacterium]|nr:50S ribosomal protein L25 [Bdellovibrionales bacterium]